MKSNLSLLFAFMIIVLGTTFLIRTSEAQVTVNHLDPYNFQSNYLKSVNLPAGTSTDSVIVRLSNGWFGRVQSPAGYTVNTGITVGQTKAQLNTLYPNVPVGHLVLCPNIALGGAVYIKATEAGSSDVWQTISAPPTL